MRVTKSLRMFLFQLLCLLAVISVPLLAYGNAAYNDGCSGTYTECLGVAATGSAHLD
jgi:hypothetical protein